MSVNPPFHPISNLSEDILLHIFKLNADMLSDADALDTTRITSQVCHSWRHLMLSTSSLWARLIDMDCISYPWSAEWRHELIRRSGDAPLWIHASRSSQAMNISEFFDTIEKNWHRIQLLLVSGHPSVDFTRLPLGIPAPQLESFEVIFGRSIGGEIDAEAGPARLFGGHAPKLRNLNISNYKIVDQHEPWLGHLFSLALNGAYSGGDLLEILSEAQNIHELQISSNVNGNTPSSCPTVFLPHLEFLQFDGSPLPCAVLMNHANIPQGCVLYLSIDGPDAADEEALISVVSAFTHHTQRFLQSNVLHTVDLQCYLPNGFISFDGQSTMAEVDYSHGISFPLLGDNLNGSQHLTMILGKLALLDFSSTTTFKFNAECPLNLSFGPFFSRFPLLDTICLDTTSLEYLMLIQDKMNATNEPRIMFPRLKVIKFSIISSRYCGCQTEEQVSTAVKFILSRVQCGHPIALLDMRKKVPLDSHPDLDALAEVNGLEVLYTRSLEESISEHTWSACGTKEFTDSN
ncbi:hypothetical protein HYPSUDRAFT_200355 [Hypholoma sublateritium FD-334 SS-4]|uniref:Uncharacterized protein n=1 Tax=Hypholoma sublateritium (strain FD-334 SS-4) TaxID=945553 RepID=A0A0D2MLR6_HYPSF|nr:hypothetical protein HYPSUDRAFT_200355 [Hypholoma sublateritium FD-334 SS-4]